MENVGHRLAYNGSVEKNASINAEFATSRRD